MNKQGGFQKFIKPKVAGAKKKEQIKQEKRKFKKERAEYFDKKKDEARSKRLEARGQKFETGQRPTTNRQQTTPDDNQSYKAKNIKQPIVLRKETKEQMPLNKYLAHCGVCARREAAEWVKAGKVIVNGKTVTEPGYKVTATDEIKVNGKKLHLQKNLVYILLNKPKDFITSTSDPQGRKTVIDIVKNATPERVYPVGRLDRNTTGVLLLTNDGELTQKLSHPSFQIKKIYEVRLDKPLLKKDFDKIISGINLDDGFIAPDSLAYDPKDKSIVGIEIHSGRNRIVRRIFEALGYDVRNLDRVMYANLTKKNVDRGKWRFLNEKEIRLLKFMNSSFTKKETAPSQPSPKGKGK
jgi:23S rRNA pseudouridine2605 synthase